MEIQSASADIADTADLVSRLTTYQWPFMWEKVSLITPRSLTIESIAEAYPQGGTRSQVRVESDIQRRIDDSESIGRMVTQL